MPVATPMTMRPVSWRDIWALYRWRRDPVTAEMSMGPVPTLLQHLRWYRSQARGGLIVIWIADVAGWKVGTVRLKWEWHSRRQMAGWVISITVAPKMRGQGHGRAMLARVLMSLEASIVRPYTLSAVVKRENLASQELFYGAGFVPTVESTIEQGPFVFERVYLS